MPALSKCHFYFPTVSRLVKYRKYRRRKWNKWPFLGLNLISVPVFYFQAFSFALFSFVWLSPPLLLPLFTYVILWPVLMCYTCVCPLTSSSVRQSLSESYMVYSFVSQPKYLLLKRLKKKKNLNFHFLLNRMNSFFFLATSHQWGILPSSLTRWQHCFTLQRSLDFWQFIKLILFLIEHMLWTISLFISYLPLIKPQ